MPQTLVVTGGILGDFYISDRPMTEGRTTKVVTDANGLPMFRVYCVIKWDDNELKLSIETSDTGSVEMLEAMPFDFKLSGRFSTYNASDGTTFAISEYEVIDTFKLAKAAEMVYAAKLASRKTQEKSVNGAKSSPEPEKKSGS